MKDSANDGIRAGVHRLFRIQLRDPKRIQSDADDELASFLDERRDDLVAHGMTPSDAEAEAIQRLGNGASVDEVRARLRTSVAHREKHARVTEWLSDLRQDLRFAARQLVRSPGFTIVVVLTLALGIGATSAIFSVVYSVILRPLSFAHADRLLSLRERYNKEDTGGSVVTAGNFGAWVGQAHDFESLGAYGFGGATLTGSGDPQSLRLVRASAGYWRALYLPPLVGRYFNDEEDRPGTSAVVVLSQRLWQSTFGSDRSVVGRSIELSGVPYTVVGVAPADYNLTAYNADAWTPLALSASDLAQHADHEYQVVGLVRDGVTKSRALAELTRVESSLAKQYPEGHFDGAIVSRPLLDAFVGSARKLLLTLLGATALVLLIACGNISSLLLARAGVREKEMAVRRALGAGRSRIVRQLVCESLLLAIVGALAGLGFAAAGVRFLILLTPDGSVPRLSEVTLNGPVMLFALLLSVGCGLLFGLYPALRATKPDLQQALREGGRDAAGTRSSRLREGLVIAEVAIALVLLVSAGLLVRSQVLLQQVDPGFDMHNVLVAGVSLPQARYESDGEVQSTWKRIEESIAAVPGVRSVGMASRIPIADGGYDCRVRAEGSADGVFSGANIRGASPGYLATMRIPLERGRFFNAEDVPTSPPVVVVNRALGRRLFGASDPIGRRIADCVGGAANTKKWWTVVGVIGDMHVAGLDQDASDEVYFANSQIVLERGVKLVVRGAVPVATLTPAIRRVVAQVDPLLPLSHVETMEDIVARSLAVSRFTMLLLLVLGAMGLTLSLIGVYGVIAYLVVQRTREIGVRMALGATEGSVVRLVVREGLVLAGFGVLIGCVLSLLATRILGSMLFQAVNARDPLTIGGVAILIAVVSAAASALPAFRAARVGPMAAIQ